MKSINEGKWMKKVDAVSKALANEAWRMLSDDCKASMKPLERTYKASLRADIQYEIGKLLNKKL